MYMLTRRSLASAVCPSTPFLLPPSVLLPFRSVAPHRPFAFTSLTRLTSRKKNRITESSFNKLGIINEGRRDSLKLLSEPVQTFRSFVEQRDFQKVQSLYPQLIKQQELTPEDTRRLAINLHNLVRNSDHPYRVADQLYPFIKTIVEDIKENRLPPHPVAHVHLLTLLKTSTRFDLGYEFWQWLHDQEDGRYVDQAVYGAAIELLAYQGRVGLKTLEDLYEEGLKRFPGTFAEYHMSPEAIIPDKTQPTIVAGLPMTLLQGILTARLLHHDWKRSYLALDTALRLFPTQTPPRFLQLFSGERPVEEAYTIFQIACRSGMQFKPASLTYLLSNMGDLMTRSSTQDARLSILSAMINALYAHVGVGGSIKGPHFGCLMWAFGNLLPEELRQSQEGDSIAMRNMIVSTGHAVIRSLVHASVPLSSDIVRALFILGGRLGSSELVMSTLQDMEAGSLKLDDAGLRNLVSASGAAGRSDLVERFWNQLSSHIKAEGRRLSYKDWSTFARACANTDCQPLFQTHFRKLQHKDRSRIENRIQSILSEKMKPLKEPNFRPLGLSQLLSRLEGIQHQALPITELISKNELLDFKKHPIPIYLDPSRPELGSTEDLRAVYEEFTTDPHQPLANPNVNSGALKPAMSSTGLPFDELRFLNWVAINEMMSLAKVTHNEFKAAIEEAIAAGQPFYGTSYARPFNPEASTKVSRSLQQIREDIKQLRSPGSSKDEDRPLEFSSPL